MPNKYKISIAVAIALVVVVAICAFFFLRGEEEVYVEPVVEVVEEDPRISSIGESVLGRDIESYTYGNGDRKILFVGGIHGGYEWNSVYLMHRYIDWLEDNPESIPESIELTVIPVLNPDGLYAVVGTADRFDPADTPSVKETEIGRFNANEVDLNRNFDCNWQPESTWREAVVDAGDEVFSEPEAQAFRDFVLVEGPRAVIFWHSASDAVYASQCGDGILTETKDLMNAYADAAGYKAIDEFEHYEITGDAGDWLATINVPSIAVEMASHDMIEFDKELDGIEAVLEYFNVDR